MKILLIAVLGILFWNSTDARQFAADSLNTMAEVIEPSQAKTLGETLDGLLGQ
tara:strand:- start:214 stop:372 length:159 start_codon:yes stop_codon:yes gene_type:complete